MKEGEHKKYGPDRNFRRRLLLFLGGVLGGWTGIAAQSACLVESSADFQAAALQEERSFLDTLSVRLEKGDVAGAVNYGNFVLQQDSTEAGKAVKAYEIAVELGQKDAYVEAASFCKKALSYDIFFGKAHLLLARLYAAHPCWTEERALNQCTYYLVLDNLIRAKQLDVALEKESDELLALYSKKLPTRKDLFMLGYTTGDRVHIGGWIGESIIIR